jgi:hypothetical protein
MEIVGLAAHSSVDSIRLLKLALNTSLFSTIKLPRKLAPLSLPMFGSIPAARVSLIWSNPSTPISSWLPL